MNNGTSSQVPIMIIRRRTLNHDLRAKFAYDNYHLSSKSRRAVPADKNNENAETIKIVQENNLVQNLGTHDGQPVMVVY